MQKQIIKITSDVPESYLSSIDPRVESQVPQLRIGSESSKNFSSRVKVKSWLGRIWVEWQERSSHFEQSVWKFWVHVKSNEIRNLPMPFFHRKHKVSTHGDPVRRCYFRKA